MKVEPTPGRDLLRGLQMGLVICLFAFCATLLSAGWIWVQGTITAKACSEIYRDSRDNLMSGMAMLLETKSAAADTGPMEMNMVVIRMDGQDLPVASVCATVAELLEQQGVTLNKLDRVYPSPSSPVRTGLLIKVIRVERAEEVQKLPVQNKTVFKRDPNLWRGQSRLLDEGSPGEMEKRFQVYRKDGEETLRKLLSQKVVKAPRPKVLAVGTKYTKTARYSREDANISIRKTLTMQATAYDPGPASCGPYADGYTSIGLKAGYGVVAVDPRVIPMRSRLFIEGYGYAIAGDVGGAIKGNRIDLGFDTRREALNFGRRTIKVHILD